jgi:hypothetical protein
MSFDDFPNELVAQVFDWLGPFARLQLRATERRMTGFCCRGDLNKVGSRGMPPPLNPFHAMTECVIDDNREGLRQFIDPCLESRGPRRKMQATKYEWILMESVRIGKYWPIDVVVETGWKISRWSRIVKSVHHRSVLDYLFAAFGESAEKVLKDISWSMLIRIGYCSEQARRSRNLADFLLQATVPRRKWPPPIKLEQILSPKWGAPDFGRVKIPETNDRQVMKWLLERRVNRSAWLGFDEWYNIAACDPALVDWASARFAGNNWEELVRFALARGQIEILEYCRGKSIWPTKWHRCNGSRQTYEWLMKNAREEFATKLRQEKFVFDYCKRIMWNGDLWLFRKIFPLATLNQYMARDLVDDAITSRQLGFLQFLLTECFSTREPKLWFNYATRRGRYRAAELIEEIYGVRFKLEPDPYGDRIFHPYRPENRHEYWRILKRRRDQEGA